MIKHELNNSEQLPNPETIEGYSKGFVTAVRDMSRLWDDPTGGIEYVSQPGEVIAMASQSERNVLDDPEASGFSVFTKIPVIDINKEGFELYFPGLAASLHSELELIGAEDAEHPARLSFSFSKGMKLPSKNPDDDEVGWHFDNNSRNIRSGKAIYGPELFYVIANKVPTEYYQGEARAGCTTLTFDGDSNKVNRFAGIIHNEGKIDIVQRPEYALVRFNPLSVHREPLYEEPTLRTFMRITVSPDLDWESFVLDKVKGRRHIDRLGAIASE